MSSKEEMLGGARAASDRDTSFKCLISVLTRATGLRAASVVSEADVAVVVLVLGCVSAVIKNREILLKSRMYERELTT